jgi:hypothetical protein
MFRRDNLPACRRAAEDEARASALVEAARTRSADRALSRREEPVEA